MKIRNRHRVVVDRDPDGRARAILLLNHEDMPVAQVAYEPDSGLLVLSHSEPLPAFFVARLLSKARQLIESPRPDHIGHDWILLDRATHRFERDGYPGAMAPPSR